MKFADNVSFRFHFSLMFVLIFNFSCFSQNTDSDQNIDPNNKGVILIKEAKYEEANKFFSEEIKKDESDKDAYLNRGNALWEMNEEENACRDWSYLLALGDTAAFKLLDAKCHGTMVIEGDTLHAVQYHKMFANDKKKLSSNAAAMTIVDEMPEFPGGTKALIEYLQKNIKYPESARKQKIEGHVYINFVISRKGKILLPYVVRGIDKACNEEALRVIRNMPSWKPGKQKGKPMLVRYNLPVSFALK